LHKLLQMKGRKFCSLQYYLTYWVRVVGVKCNPFVFYILMCGGAKFNLLITRQHFNHLSLKIFFILFKLICHLNLLPTLNSRFQGCKISIIVLRPLQCRVKTQSKGVKGAKVKVLFQGLHMTHVISMLVYNLNCYILDT
jgi:hypothetical protein